jgi:hypothetical protein
LGKYKMKYLAFGEGIGEASDPHGRDFHVESVPFPKTPNDSQPVNASISAATTTGLPLAAIRLLSGSNAGRELQLLKTSTTLGKPGVQVAVIARRPRGYFLTHGEGKVLPTVNGKVLDFEGYCLQNRDVIEIAGVKMEFFLKE